MFFQNSNVVELKECVACGSKELTPVLDLGKQPLANSYKLNKEDIQEEYPLAINHCDHCFHVQLTHAVNPKLMFEDYLYVSGTAKTMHDHCRDFANISDSFVNSQNKTVFDIGCNDGTQLNYFKELGYRTFGIDPARNLHKISSKEHVVFCDWFNNDFVDLFSWSGISFDLITAQNVFAHGPEPLQFLLNARRMMTDDTTLIIQTSQANMIKNNEFDTIYHEHISFFNTLSMKHLCERAGLHLNEVRHMPIHGTSYVFIINKNKKNGNVDDVILSESSDGLYTKETYVKYAQRCDEVVKSLVVAVSNYTRNDLGWLAVGYGAPAKGMTLLNYSKLKLDFIIDDNELKQGRFTPGSSIPIYPASKLDEHQDAICFVPLAWNFYDEIVSKIKSKRNNKYDRFITYFPEVKDNS